jgi:serine/threonine protein kinase
MVTPREFIFERQLSVGTELGTYCGISAVFRKPCDGIHGLVDRSDEVTLFNRCADITGIPQILWHNNSFISRCYSEVSLIRTFIEGKTVQELVDTDAHSELSYLFYDNLREIVSQIHARGYSGLDIKSTNVGLSCYGKPFLFDFGTVFKMPVCGIRKWHHRVYKNLDFVDIDQLQRGEFRKESCSQLYFMESNCLNS